MVRDVSVLQRHETKLGVIARGGVDEQRARDDGADAPERLPEAAGPRHVHVGSGRDRVRDVTGLDCRMWGNDYPHREGSYPFSQEWVDKQFADVPEDEIDAMVRGNAARVFGINI
jgi:hypothetical protein